MVGRSARAALATIAVFFVNSAAALAAGSDPTKIGENVRDIVSPNVKALWWVLLVFGLLFMAATRKASRAGGAAFILILSGIAIYNPAGTGSFMQGLADKII